MRKCLLTDLNAVFAAIAENETLYLPVDGENGADYKKWEAGVEYGEKIGLGCRDYELIKI